ncbi:hypothetical protein KOW79_017167 [Hemibagrus wyckioides]|uniref:Uncharacterized protein n=1 Tax=Hemibagrus wyckioides TaxID=337641 RepID=A0A9D3NEI2_9TELE|nr:hypothetical protein KOW79_017167 [Hemibagrus wyckioides]
MMKAELQMPQDRRLFTQLLHNSGVAPGGNTVPPYNERRLNSSESAQSLMFAASEVLSASSIMRLLKFREASREANSAPISKMPSYIRAQSDVNSLPYAPHSTGPASEPCLMVSLSVYESHR